MKGVKHLKSKSLIGNKRTTFASSFEEHSIGKASVPKRRSGSIHIVPTRGYCHCCHELASRSINFSDIGTRPPSAKKKSIARLFDTTKNILIKEKL